MGPDGPKWGQEDLFPTNPDLPDILGRTDFDFENFYFFAFLDPKFPDFQVPDFQISRNLAWAQLGPGLGPAWGPAWAQAFWAQLGPLAWAGGPSGGPGHLCSPFPDAATGGTLRS